MDDYALVLNAGSSSLKFCVYRRRPDGDPWRLEARGQIDGIGTTPRFSAKDDAGERLIDAAARRDRARRRAPRSTRSPSWLRARYGGARVLGVGHRVVHGGADLRRADDRHAAGPRRAARADAARAAASAAQPRRHRRGGRAAARRAAGGLLRHQLPSRPAGRRRARAAAARRCVGDGVQRYGFHGLSYEYIASVLPQVAPGDRRRARDRRAPRQRRQPVRAEERQERRQHARVHRARRAVHGHAARRARSRRRPLSVPEPRACPPKEVETILYKKSGLLGISGISNDMRDLLGSTEPDGAGWPSTTSSIAPPRRSARSPPSSAASTGWSSPPASARTRRRSASASARPRPGSASSSTPTRTRRTAPRISRAGSRVSAWVIPTNEELMIARHTGRLLGLVDARAQRAGQ